MNTRLAITLGLFTALAGCVGGGESEEDRGPIGKADLVGSCESSSCDGKSDGNCWCDTECDLFDDCCEDKELLCDSAFSIATYNVGLAHGAVALSPERLPKIIEALKTSTAEVMCLQEVWTDEDIEAIRAGVEEVYPHSFVERTSDDSSNFLQCNPFKVFMLDRCVSSECTPKGISAFECVANQCASRYSSLTDSCKLCLAANTQSPWRCAAWGAKEYAWDGHNGLVLLSKQPLEDVRYTEFDTVLVKRGVISARVDGKNVQCTHMTSELSSVPYPDDREFAGWEEEHLAQMTIMADQAPAGECTLLLGDLNTGPAEGDMTAELERNFVSLQDLGYEETWFEPECTYCKTNPLVGGEKSNWLDHIMLKGCNTAAGMPTFRVIFDEEISVKFDGNDLETRLSDHYGLQAAIPAAALEQPVE